MLTSSFRLFAQCCKASAGLMFILLNIIACADARPPLQPTDPATVARQVVADYLSVPITEVTLVSLEAQEFNDSSLGCPEPGMAYQQVVTSGHRIIAEAEGRRFDVRIAGGHGRICRNNKRSKAPLNSNRESAVTIMIDHARHDLADILEIDKAKIQMRDIRPYDGENLPIGCTPQCESDQSCGYMIGLFYAGRRYDYHAVAGTAAACPPILPM
jgi:hypothetical protein